MRPRLTLPAAAVAHLPLPRAVRRALDAGAVFPAPPPGRPSTTGPITSWVGAAALLGVSTDTLARRRADRGDVYDPWWATPADVRAWYASLVAPVPRPARAPRRSRAPTAPDDEAITDYHALLRR